MNKKNKLGQTLETLKKLKRQLGIIVAVIGAVLYINTINHDYVLDDFSVIKDNDVVTLGTKGIPTIFKTSYRYGYFQMDDGLYRPLTLAMFAIEWSIAKDTPALNHFMNVLLYAFSGYLLFIVLARLLKQYNIIIPFAISLLFIAHPIHTEVVANIKSRDEILSFLLAFASIYYLMDYFDSNKASKLVKAAVLYFLALLSKESPITMLAAIPLMFYFFTDVKPQKYITATFVLAGAAGIYLLIRGMILKGHLTDTSLSLVDNLLVAGKNMGEQKATAILIAGMYLKLLVYPHPLAYDYSFKQIPISTFSSPYVLLTFFIFAGAIAYAILRFKKKDPIAFGILFYLITYSLFSNILFNIGAAMGERFIYFSSLGFCFVIVFVIEIFLKAVTEFNYSTISDIFMKNPRFIGTVFLITVLYSCKTVTRNFDWKNNYTLYSNDLSKIPNSTRAYYYLGNWIIKEIAPQEKDKQKRIERNMEGIGYLKRSLEIYPFYTDAMSQTGVGYYRIDSLDQAAKYFLETLKLNPNDATTLNNLGSIYFTKRDYAQCLKALTQAVQINPRYADAIVNLASCYGTLGQVGNPAERQANFEAAIKYFRLAIDIQPYNARAMFFLGKTYENMGDKANAQQYMQQAQAIDPNLR